MGILADQVDYVIGVDTHRDAHSAAIVTAVTGAVTNTDAIPADAFGNRRVLRFATLHAQGVGCGRSNPAAAMDPD